jgi:hypothetical protein
MFGSQYVQVAQVANSMKTVNQHADTVLMMNHVTMVMAPVLMAAKKATKIPSAQNLQLNVKHFSMCVLECVVL